MPRSHMLVARMATLCIMSAAGLSGCYVEEEAPEARGSSAPPSSGTSPSSLYDGGSGGTAIGAAKRTADGINSRIQGQQREYEREIDRQNQ